MKERERGGSIIMMGRREDETDKNVEKGEERGGKKGKKYKQQSKDRE